MYINICVYDKRGSPATVYGPSSLRPLPLARIDSGRLWRQAAVNYDQRLLGFDGSDWLSLTEAILHADVRVCGVSVCHIVCVRARERACVPRVCVRVDSGPAPALPVFVCHMVCVRARRVYVCVWTQGQHCQCLE